MGSNEQPKQRVVATAEMVAWLAFPTELGAPPDDIELLETVDVMTADGPGDLFVFRFRTNHPHWAADKGWMVGVAGPYARSNQPHLEGLGYTFSKLRPEKSMSVEQHVEDLIGTVADWIGASIRPIDD